MQAEEKNNPVILEACIKETQDFFLSGKREKLYKHIVEMVEKPLIEIVLGKTRGNKIQAAKMLGINRNTLHSKLKKLKIDAKRFKDSFPR